MKKILIVSVFTLLGVVTSLAQDKTMSIPKEICNRLEIIEHRDSLLPSIRKETILIDTLNAQIADYKYVANSFEALIKQKSDSITMLTTELHLLKLMLSDSVEIFSDTILTFRKYPLCLEKRMTIISKVIEANNLLSKIEDTVDTLQEKYSVLDDIDKIKYINREIQSDTDKLYDLLETILSLDLSVLSEEQKAYIKPGLTERYNKLQKYFE